MNKVIWTEGILLAQQHLQQWDNYQQLQQRDYLRYLLPNSWGLIDLEIEQTALLNGILQVNKCVLIFPDRKLVNYEKDNNFVLSCDLSTSEQEEFSIYLGVPLRQGLSAVTGYPDYKTTAGFIADYREVADIYDASRKREVLFGCENLKLFCDDSLDNNYCCVAIARVKKINNKTYGLVAEFIPPLVNVASNHYLLQILIRISRELLVKINVLQDNMQRIAKNSAEQLHLKLVLNKLLQLQMFLEQADSGIVVSPWELFSQLSNTAIFLATFTGMQINLPSYKHCQLGRVFIDFEQLLHKLLQQILLRQATVIDLQRRADGTYFAAQIDEFLLKAAEFFIAVKYPNSDDKWVDRFIRQTKIGSDLEINSIIASALSGVVVEHQKRLQEGLIADPECEYFQVVKNSPRWSAIVRERNLVVFLPNEFQVVQLQLLIFEGCQESCQDGY